MKILLVVIVFILGFLSGTIFGFKQGPVEFALWDSQHVASLYAYENKFLKQGRINEILNSNEVLLNSELSKFGKHLDSKYFWLFKLTGSYQSDESAIKHAVRYRIENPFVDPDLSQVSSWKSGTNMEDETIKTIVENQKENTQNALKVIELYKN